MESLTIYADPNVTYFLPNAFTADLKVKRLTLWHPVLHNMQFYKDLLISTKSVLRGLRVMLYDPRVDLDELIGCIELDRIEELSLMIWDGVAWYRESFNHQYRTRLV